MAMFAGIEQACVTSAEDISRAEGVSELLSWHCADATRPGVLDELGLAATTAVFLYVYPTLLSQLKVPCGTVGLRFCPCCSHATGAFRWLHCPHISYRSKSRGCEWSPER